MFFHSVKYSFLGLIRSKDYIFWCLLFPIVLGTLFYIAFGNMNQDELFVPVKTAVVLQDTQAGKELKAVLDEVCKEGESQLLEIAYVTRQEAEELLRQKEVSGIIYGGEEISLSVSAEMHYDQLNQSILQAFVEQFQTNYGAMKDIYRTHPEKLPAAMEVLNQSAEYNKQIIYADSNMDAALSYYFNLIAMACLFGCTAGVQIAVHNQANQSTLAMRKRISPVHKMTGTFAELTSTFLLQSIIVCISVLYMRFILKLDFGGNLGYILLAVAVGSITGVSLGFFAGCIGKISADTKVGIVSAVTMVCCFLSGLMVEGMRIFVEQAVPFINRINPAALISDSFYALSVYKSYTRYYQNIGSLLLISAIFCLFGILIVRRERYASL